MAVDPATTEHMTDPQVGDRFHEFYSFWMQVIGRTGEVVTVHQSSGGVRAFATLAEFQAAYSYKDIPGYWIRFLKNMGEE